MTIKEYKLERGFDSLCGFHVGQQIEREMYDAATFLSYTLTGEVDSLEKITDEHGTVDTVTRVVLTSGQSFIVPCNHDEDTEYFRTKLYSALKRPDAL